MLLNNEDFYIRGTINMEPLDVMWIIKYRPKKINEMIGEEKYKISKYLEHPASMPHLLFHSVSPGSGKTTLATVIINELGADALFLNTSDERKIDTVREKVKQFIQTKSSKPGVRRVVFMDEADGLTKDAQHSLRTMMETYAENALFILTCNSVNSIIAPLKDRCVVIGFKPAKQEEQINYLKMICENEHMIYDEEGLKEILKKNPLSLRSCVSVLQELKTEGKDVLVETAKESDDTFEQLWLSVYDKKDWNYAKTYILQHGVNVRELNKFFWLKAVNTSNIKMIQITASNEDRFSRGGEEVIIFVSSLIDMTR